MAAPPCASALQLLQKIREIKKLFLRLNLPLLIESEMTNALQEENLSALGRKNVTSM